MKIISIFGFGFCVCNQFPNKKNDLVKHRLSINIPVFPYFFFNSSIIIIKKSIGNCLFLTPYILKDIDVENLSIFTDLKSDDRQ